MKERINSISRRKLIAVAVAAAVLLCGAIGGVIAYLQAETEEVENTFVAGDTNITIEERFDKNFKTSIKVTNLNDSVPAYIRASVFAYMTDSNGNPTTEPIPSGYFDPNVTAGWFDSANWYKASDGFYYYKNIVPVGDSKELIASGKKLEMATGQNIVVLAEAIQAAGKDSGVPAVVKAWGPVVSGINSDGSLIFS